MNDIKQPNATQATPDNARSQGASGDVARGDPDAREKFNGLSGAGQSGGGAYPNPHSGKEGGGNDGFMGHGGQTEMPYHGTGRLGEDETGRNPNAGAAKGRPDQKDDYSGRG
jgi:hypothetical protein